MIHKFTTTVENEIDIDLPIFFKVKNFDSYFAIFDKEAIALWGNDVQYSRYPEIYLKYLKESSFEEISKDEFKTNLIRNCNLLISKF